MSSNAIVFSYPLLIKEAYLDSFGHMNNATYLTLFEEARWDFVTKNGYGLKRIMASGIGPTILEITIRFLKEICLRDEIVIESTFLSYDAKISKLQQSMLRDNQLCCQAEFTIALFDLQQRKLILPTPEWLEAIGVVTP